MTGPRGLSGAAVDQVPLRLTLARMFICTLVRHRFVDAVRVSLERQADGTYREVRSKPQLVCSRCAEPYVADAPIDVVDRRP